MNRLSKLLGAMASVTLLAGCATTTYTSYDDGSYYAAPGYAANYDDSCDYYSPPWGYPADYCRYQTWNEPVYYGGLWYSGPIYYRNYAGANWFWLNGDWRRDEWRGSRPAIDWNRNRYWRGEIVRARNDFRDRRDAGARPDFNERRDFDNRRDAGNRNFDNNGRGRDERDLRNGRNDAAPRNNDNNGRFGGRGPGNMERANYGPAPGPGGGAQNPPPNTVQGGRFDGRGPGNAERANNNGGPPDGGRGPRNNAASNPPPANALNAAPPPPTRNAERETSTPPPQPGRGLVGGLQRARAAATGNDADNNNR